MTVTSALPVLEGKINTGGFGDLFIDPRNPAQCIKVLKRPIAGAAARSLARLLSFRNWMRPSEVETLLARIAWPVEIFGTAERIAGYTMPLAPDSCFFDLRVLQKTTRRPMQLKFLMDREYWSSAAVTSLRPAVDEQDLIEIAIDCFDTIDLLHAVGLCYGDISNNNIVARLDDQPGVFFFDADSIAPFEERASIPLVTPGWEAPPGLDPASIDRSRSALLLFRLLVEDLNARPQGSQLDILDSGAGLSLKADIARAYQTGSIEAFTALSTGLREQRDSSRSRRAFDKAREAGWARAVVREEIGALDAEGRDLLRQASIQLEFEASIEAASGWHLRKLERQFRLSGSPFRLDVRSRKELAHPPSSVAELRSLAIDAQFTEIASHLSSAGLITLESNPLLERAVQHALVEHGAIPFDIALQPGKAEIKFQWPKVEYINTALLRVRGPNFDEQSIVVRDESPPIRSIEVDVQTEVSIDLTPGTVSPSGTHVWSPATTSCTRTIPGQPRPSAPARGLIPAGHSAPTMLPVLIDPIQAARDAAARQALLRRQRGRRTLGALTLFAILATATWFIVDRVTSWSRPSLQVTAGETQWNFAGTDDQIRIWWSSLDPRVTALRVQTSQEGDRWTDVSLDELDLSQRSASFSTRSQRGTPLLVRVQPLIGDSALAPRVQASWLDGSGFTAPPTVSESMGLTTIRWSPVLRVEQTPPSFDYRLAAGAPYQWEYFSTAATSLAFVVPSTREGWLFLAVRSRYADGSVGPWIEAAPHEL